ncbi:MAG: PVC-type heme-binding CxxCH protein [Planctomycetota bacterium]
MMTRTRQIGWRWLPCLLAIGFPIVPATASDPIEPEIADASDEAEQAMSVMRIPEQWRVNLFAAEPDVANVVAMDVDGRGRLFVCETFRQTRGVTDNRAHDEEWLLADLAAETVQDRIDYHKRLLGDAAVTYAQHDDRIRRIVDTDGDGQADVSTVLANGFNGLEEGTGAGVLAHGSDVYYACIPKLWRLTDADDDGVADQRVAMSDGYGVRVAFRGHDMHGLIIGPDGRLYFSIGDRGYHVTTDEGSVLSDPATGTVFRCELDGRGLEVFARGLRNPQELAFNDLGDWFTVDNNSDSGDKARVVHLLRGGDSGWRMHYQYLPDRGPFNRQRLWEPLHAEQPAHIVPPIVNLTDGPSGLAFYPGTGFGDELRDQFLVCDFRGGPSNSGIRSFSLRPDGAFYTMTGADQPIWNVLATDVTFGPGGELFVSDWVDGWNGLGKGRIYRITHPDHEGTDIVSEVKILLAGDWTTRDAQNLQLDLEHIDRRVRLHAQWELARRGEVDRLLVTASDTKLTSHVRLHGMWGSQHAARLNRTIANRVTRANRRQLADDDPVIRAAACGIAGEQRDEESIERLGELVADSSPRVSMFATMALADLSEDAAPTQRISLDQGRDIRPNSSPATRSEQLVVVRAGTQTLTANKRSLGSTASSSIRESVLRQLAEKGATDPAIRHAATRYLQLALNAESLVALQDHDSVTVRRAAVAALRRRGDGRVGVFLQDPHPVVMTEAAMAIHDVPIPVAMEDLANQIHRDDLPVDQDALVRRVVSANYQIGTNESAAALAAAAASAAMPEWARVEALDCLLHWAHPDPRCRVTNTYRPIPKRSDSPASDSLERRIDELMIAGETVRDKAIEVASQLGLTKISPQLIGRVRNLEARPSTRAASLIALSRLRPESAVELATGIALTDAVPLASAALQVLGQHAAAKSRSRFIEATRSDVARVRGIGWDLLAASDDPLAAQRIAEGIDAYLSGDLPPDVHINVIEAARRRLPEKINQRVEAFRTQLAETDPLAKWLPSLHGGDPDAGSKLFFGKTELSCVRCHKVGRAGGEVGPNLTKIGKALDRRTLLESICLPSAKIAKGFETAVIADEDGQVFTGIVASEDEEIVELIAADGSRNQIWQDMIIARKKGKSSMPSGLADLITERQLRDLVAYLASLQVDQRGADDTE